MRVVIVDDDTLQLRALERRTRDNPQVELFAIDNAIDALLAIGSLHPDLVVIDVFMPGLDGPSLLKKARKYLGDAPVMFISGSAESDFSDLLQDEVGVSFLPKPLDIKTLAERVKQELRAA